MQLRTVAFVLVLFAASWTPPRPLHAGAARQATPALRGLPIEPLPFLASGLVVFQAPASEAGPGINPARHTTTALPSSGPEARLRGTKRTAAPARPFALRAAVLACRLGTPPPATIA